MSSSFPDSFDQFADESLDNASNSFDENYLSPYAFSGAADHSPAIDVSDLSDFSSQRNFNEPILPYPEEIDPEEGYVLREWRRQNAIRLEEKEKIEKDLLSKIITEADEHKVKFNREWLANRETNRASNREKETVFVASQEKFYAEADKDYWKSITELIPKEVPTIETRKGKKDQEKEPSTTLVVQGPKPGKRTDLARMRQILIKLKHDTPLQLKPSPPSAADAKTEAPVVASSSESVAVA